MRLGRMIDAAQRGQRGHLMPWAPVMLGLGVGGYFALPAEPRPDGLAALAALALALAFAGRRWRGTSAGLAATALALLLAGLCVAALRTQAVSAPILGFRYYGPIEGRVVLVDRSASDRVRLTLDRVVLARTDPARVPARVRVSLHGQQGFVDPVPGTRVMMTGHLSPPEGPGEPGGFDFQRHAWFLGVGAVGYTRVPALLLEPRPPGALRIDHLRMGLSRTIQARIAGDAGAFAAAVLTGDRSGIPAGPLQDLRRSNIAHLLAISGLHMGLLTGFVFTVVRLGLAGLPWVALRWPIRKWAALTALIAGGFYLALSGGNVATERAFIQVAVMFTAVLLDRRAITLRSVAIAAVIVLLHRPESLLGPGFQMSFAATTALVAVFGLLRGTPGQGRVPRWARAVLALVISSAVAGAATAPFSAAHFNQVAAYGLLANLLTVPVMGSVVIPAAVLAGLLWPVGLEGLALMAMEAGLAWILWVAQWVSALPGAVRPVVAPPQIVLPLITLGMLGLMLWQGRARAIGLLPCLAALWLWAGAERPQLLVSSSGRLAGLITDQGRALSRPRGDGFVARLWLENDGDGADQAGAAARAGWREDGAGRVADLAGLSLWHGVGRRAAAELEGACARHDIVLTSEPVDGTGPAPALPLRAVPLAAAVAADAPAPCLMISAETLRRTGALALSTRNGQMRFTSADALQGARPWARNRGPAR